MEMKKMDVLTGDSVYVIGKYLEHTDIVNLCHVFYKNWKKLDKMYLLKVANKVDDFFRSFFEKDYDEFVKNMITGKGVVSGSFLIQIMLNETWKGSDIDIYHSYDCDWRTSDDEDYWSPLENFLYKKSLRRGDSASQDYDFFGSKINGYNPVIIRRICDYPIKGIKFQTLQFEKVTEIANVYKLLKAYVDFDICKNIFYYDEKGFHIKIFKASDIINKATKFNFGFAPDLSLKRAEKYTNRGFIFLPTMRMAGIKGEMDKVKDFLQKGQSQKEMDVTMTWAARMGHMNIVNLMIENGATDFDTALYQAGQNKEYGIVKEEQLEIVKMFVERIKEPNKHVEWTIESHAIDIVHMLIEKGATNFIDVAIKYPQHCKILLRNASSKGYLDIVRTLINLGINDFELSWQHCPSIQIISNNGHIDIVLLMVEKGSLQFDSAMIGASQGGHIEIIKLMIEKGANMFGNSLSRAAEGGHLNIIEFLIKQGNIQKGNELFKYAMCHAKRYNHMDVYNYLKEWV